MNVAERVLRGVDKWQQSNRNAGFLVAVILKFGDDRAGALASLIAYNPFLAVFPFLRLPNRPPAPAFPPRGRLHPRARPGRPYTAQIQAIDPLIDANGRSIGIRGCIDNRQLQLRPGMFARVNTVFGVKDDARVIPEEAIVPQGGKQFVIKLLNAADPQTRTTPPVQVQLGPRSPGKSDILVVQPPHDPVVPTGDQRVPRTGTHVPGM